MWRLEVGVAVFVLVLAVEWGFCSDRFLRWCARVDRRLRLQ